jgi:hypothetical protein
VSSADRLLSARISGICGRRCASGRIDAPDAAVAELRQVAGNRPDLLAAHAGLALGLAEVNLLAAPRYRAEAELARLAGADEAHLAGWMEIGRKRAEQARLRPYTG